MTDARASHSDEQGSDLTAEQKADASADLKVTLLVFFTLVAISVVTISGWSPQF